LREKIMNDENPEKGALTKGTKNDAPVGTNQRC
jgi:hypothetical protein